MLGRPWGRLIGLTSGLLYALIALVVGQMLVFGRTGVSGLSFYSLRQVGPWWNAPVYIVVAPNAVLTLPLFATVSMAVVALGIGFGMGVAAALLLELRRRRREGASGAGAASSAVGLTPALVALLTLGACCSTTAAATAGIGVVAQASGSSPETLLASVWYLSLFQIAVLYVALLAQERLVAVYRVILPVAESEPSDPTVRSVPGYGRVVVRGALLLGGVTWLLAGVAEAASPGGDGLGGFWSGFLALHLVPSSFAIAAGVAPEALSDGLRRLAAHRWHWMTRSALVLFGVLLWIVPPGLASGGLHGWVNELLGAFGVPSAAGGVPAPLALGPGVVFRWAVEMALPGLWIALAGARPLWAAGVANGAPPGPVPLGIERVPSEAPPGSPRVIPGEDG